MSSAQGGPDAPPAALLCRLILTSACAEAGVGLPRLAGPSAVPSPAPSPVNQFSSVIIPMSLGAFEYGAEFVPVPPPPPPPLAVGVTTVATGEAGVSFTSDLMISGGIPPYIVSLIKGALPAGLSLGNDGVIFGTISPAAKNTKLTVRITDSVNDSVTKTFKMTILKALRVSERATTGRVGKDYKASFNVKGGLGPFNWSITSGVLPAGLSFNSATGTITGIPTQAGTFPLTVQVTDALGGVDAESLTLTVK
jgi:hypothetical protein